MSILGTIWLPIDADLDCFSCHHAITSVVLLLLMIAMNTTLLASDSAYDVHAGRFVRCTGLESGAYIWTDKYPPPPPKKEKESRILGLRLLVD